ncbi:MAG: TolC family protein [Candidatus Wallbacteria bacterium]|nr:TolC family protein [Candidatus Wallbacteria bacterium]
MSNLRPVLRVAPAIALAAALWPGSGATAAPRKAAAQAAQEARLLSLPDAVRLALTAYPRIEGATHAEQAAEHELRSAEALKLPRLSLQNILKESDNFKRFTPLGPIGPILSDINNDSAAITGAVLELPVYVGDRLAILPRIAEKKKEAQQQLKRKLVQDVILEILELYLQVLLGDKEIKIEAERLRALEAQSRQMQEQAKGDPLTAPQMLELELSAAERRQKLAASRAGVEESRRKLATLTGLAPGVALEMVPAFEMRELEGTPEDMLQTARAENPELRLLEIAHAAAGEEIGLAASEEKPQVNFRADYFNNRPFTRPENQSNIWTVALMTTWNLFDGGHSDQEKKKARSKVREARAEVAAGVRQLDLQVRHAYSTLVESRKLLDGLEKNIELARNVLDTVTEKFQVNILSRADLLEARINLSRAILNRDRVSSTVLRSRAALFRLMGRLEPDVFKSAAFPAGNAGGRS